MNGKTTKNMKTKKTTVFLAVLILLGWLFGVSTQASAQQYTCFPTCENDARFLVLSGTGLETLAGDSIEIGLAVDKNASEFNLSIFDGETGNNWDRVSGRYGPIQMDYVIYADPNADGTGTMVVWQGTGAQMINNDWYSITVGNVAPAQSPAGNYFYRLVVSNPNPSIYALNAFKIKSDGVLTVKPMAFAVQAGFGISDDFSIIYPKYADGNLTNTIYDGTFDFYFYVPATQSSIAMWDGDVDFGAYDLSTADADDPDTPNNVLPPWAYGTETVLEGVAVGINGTTGSPSDETSEAKLVRSPSVTYSVTAPNSKVWTNNNPSGNREWEQFRIAVNAPRSEADFSETTPLPSGLYRVHLSGYDIFNLAAWRFFNDVIGVCPKVEGQSANPCRLPPKPYLIGDTVWLDTIPDGIQGTGEPGIANVVVYLLDSSGNRVLGLNGQPISAKTDANGNYQFEVDGYRVDPDTGTVISDGIYTVEVGTENFANISSPLFGYRSTTGGETLTRTVNGANVMTYDFGYVPRLSGGNNSIGNFVWWDVNNNGLQDAGEPGITGVTLTLSIDYYGTGTVNETRTATTDANGYYLFIDLPNDPGVTEYTVTIDAGNYAAGGALAGYTLTVAPVGADPQLDSNPNNSVTILPLANGSFSDLSIDFGFYTTTKGGIGDFVWHDLNGNGIQDSGEPGIPGVVVELYDTSGNLIATTTTDPSGYYQFMGLPAGGRYVVKIADSNFEVDAVLPGWLASPYLKGSDRAKDSNGNTSTHKSGTVTVVGGKKDVTIDFGFYFNCIEFEKTGPDTVKSGETITYHFRVKNCGDLVLHGGASVFDEMLNPKGDHQIWHDVVYPGEVKEFDKTYTPSKGFCGLLVNNAWAEGHPLRPDGKYDPNVTADSSWVVNVECSPGGQGCSPGYWKQSQHFDSWVKYKTTDNFNTVFGVTGYNVTLLNALKAGGSGKYALGRAAVSALLNATSLGSKTLYTESQVIQIVKDGFASGNYTAAKDKLEAEWSPCEICPLN